jgi:predicted transposase YbfD/YdcC
VVQCVMPDAGVVSVAGVPVGQACCGLLDLLTGVSDGRSSQGRDHPVAVVLALVAAATVAGMTGYTAMAGWVADVPQAALTDLYLRSGALPVGRPSRSTIWRVCTDTDPQALDTAIGVWTAARRSGSADPVADRQPEGDPTPARAPADLLRLDGKTVCGAVNDDGQQLHLLAALAGSAQPDTPAVVIGQLDVPGAKTTEPARARDLLTTLDIEGSTVTADALHTVKATAELIHSRGGQLLFPVKENRRALFDALNTLPWPDVPIAANRIDTGHARITRRTIRVLPAPPDLPFPHANQVWLIERYVTNSAGTHISAAAQSHWAIESLHWIRDTCYREDDSRVHTRNGPHVLASLRNLAINALRLAGCRDITEATRWASRNMARPFTILGLTSRS